MRSNESLPTLCLMNWNHCESGTAQSFMSPKYPDWFQKRRRESRRMRKERNKSFLFIYLFLLGADCLWTHLSPSVPSPRVTCAINLDHYPWNWGLGGGGVGLLLYSQVERQHFLSVSLTLHSNFCLDLCYFHIWIQALPHNIQNHLHLLNTHHPQPYPHPLPCSSSSSKDLGRQTPLPPQRAQRTQVPEGQKSCTC